MGFRKGVIGSIIIEKGKNLTEYRLDSCGDNVLKMTAMLVRCSLVARLLLIIGGPLVLVRCSFFGYMVGTSLFVGFAIGNLFNCSSFHLSFVSKS